MKASVRRVLLVFIKILCELIDMAQVTGDENKTCLAMVLIINSLVPILLTVFLFLFLILLNPLKFRKDKLTI
ncbi:hypothetical protein BpHYR1_035565 [Brachionus plicatilis]|uniref:Uncharacterized protein n=1 Tax=Brachionus plicatilis TaxID=10195 RepID=A0A3M7P2I4_BRAPC|nr:hypothetical protein BpHYR1_035565 [Brachionus plicatilis]